MRLGIVLRKYRMSQELSLRDMARDMGIPFATLARIESGHKCDADTLVGLINWLNGPEVGGGDKQTRTAARTDKPQVPANKRRKSA